MFNSQTTGFLTLVLHAHLPYVRHPEYDFIREEGWLFEAITETYIPLISIFLEFANNNIPARVTMSLTPPLATMLSDEHLQKKYFKHITKLINLAENEIVRTKGTPYNETSHMYLNRLTLCKAVFESYNGNLIEAFRELQDKGVLEIITCTATHGFLPNMQYNEKAVKAQIEVAVKSYEKFMNRPPIGIWLAECGYYPGVEHFLEEAGIHYFFTDTHGILFSEPRPKYGVYAPVFCQDTTVAAFARDLESSRSVWSSKVGYPGDPDYREFYKDIGFDLDFEYIAPYIDPNGDRLNTGLKYHKITGKSHNKAPYNHRNALNKAFTHAGDFLFNRQKQIGHLAQMMDRPPIVVAPYDAELFGHWWYEGPNWLNYLIRKITFENVPIELITPSDYLSFFNTNQRVKPTQSSWGENGYSAVWLEASNDWIYRHIHKNEEKMSELATRYSNPTPLQERVLNQMARELLLSEASDWAFIMKTATSVDYAVRRTKEHIAAFQRFAEEIESGTIDKDFLSLMEKHNKIFPEIDYRVYS